MAHDLATTFPARARRHALAGPAGALLAVLAALGVAHAAELQFSASVDQTTVGLGDQFQLVLTVAGEDMVSVPSPVLPALTDFNVLGRTSSQSTNISIINGQFKKQATVNFIYVLSAKKLGRSVIPPTKLTYQGKEYESQPIEMTVVQEAARAAPAPQSPRTGMPGGRAPASLEGNLYLSATPSRRTVYVGEPVTLEIALFTRFQITNGGWAEAPTFDGFWAEKVFDADKFDFQRRTINGQSFVVSVLKKVVLFPLSPGQAKIKPLAFNVAVSQAPRDFFDFGATQTVRLETKPVTLEVLPLPESGKPAGFTGGVGKFTLSGTLDRAVTTNSEPVNLTLKVAGSGNVRMIDRPVFPAIEGLRILEPESKDDSRAAGSDVRGTKTFRFPIIPQSDGKYVIAPIEMAYFDPQAKAYRTMKAGPFEFSASGSAVTSPLAEASGLRVLGTDIGYIKPDAAALAASTMDLPWWPLPLYGLSFAMVGAAFWYRGHSDRLVSDRGYARRSRSSALVRRRLREAEKLLRRQDDKGFYAALNRAVMGYVGDRLNIETGALTKDQLRAEMDRLEVAPEAASAVIEIVDQCELARFSPGALESSDPKRLFERTRDSLGRI